MRLLAMAVAVTLLSAAPTAAAPATAAPATAAPATAAPATAAPATAAPATAAPTIATPKLQLGDQERYLRISGLLQFRVGGTEAGAPDGSWETDAYFRRARLALIGRLGPALNFFVQTDTPRYGLRGNNDADLFIQTAYVELGASPIAQLDVGMLLLPFSHQASQSSNTTLGMDVHPGVVQYPAGSTRGWRDFGLMVRGMPFGPILEYRVGLFNGVQGEQTVPQRDPVSGGIVNGDALRNPEDWPRLTARLVGNLFEPEGGPGIGGMFPDGLYLQETESGLVSPRRVLSLGLSLDYQPDLVVGVNQPGTEVVSREPYRALAADLFWNIPLSVQTSLHGQINAYHYDYGNRAEPPTIASSGLTGFGISQDAGLRVGRFGGALSIAYFEPTQAPSSLEIRGRWRSLQATLAYWAIAHNLTFKLMIGSSQQGTGPWRAEATSQMQVAF